MSTSLNDISKNCLTLRRVILHFCDLFLIYWIVLRPIWTFIYFLYFPNFLVFSYLVFVYFLNFKPGRNEMMRNDEQRNRYCNFDVNLSLCYGRELNAFLTSTTAPSMLLVVYLVRSFCSLCHLHPELAAWLSNWTCLGLLPGLASRLATCLSDKQTRRRLLATTGFLFNSRAQGSTCFSHPRPRLQATSGFSLNCKSWNSS